MANVLGINLSELRPAEALKTAADFLNSDKPHYAVTPNPEIILAAQHDEEFFYILNKADLALADGFGLQVAGWLNSEIIPRVTGADFTIQLLDHAAKNGIKTAVLNWQDGLSTAADIENALTKRFSGLKLSVFNIDRVKFLPAELIGRINAFGPVLLFTTLGFPYQEKVIYHNLATLPSIRLALGVGGAFDFLTGRAKRAPKIFQASGLEWLWRLIRQPRRGRRIYNATVVFLLKVLATRFLKTFLYRPNVACLLYKLDNGKKKILLFERTGEPGHWQLPQGGTDGDDIAVAGERELSEEMNNSNFVSRAAYRNLYRYKFNDGQVKNNFRGAEVQRHTFGYKGQKQGLYIAEYKGRDEDIKINFWDHSAWKWVTADKLPESVHPSRQAAAKIYLEKFRALNL